MTGKRRALHTPPAPRGDQKAGQPFDGEVWHDEDVARFFGVSVRTLARRVQNPKTGELRLVDAEHAVVGGRRFWVRESLMRLIGIKAKEVRV